MEDVGAHAAQQALEDLETQVRRRPLVLLARAFDGNGITQDFDAVVYVPFFYFTVARHHDRDFVAESLHLPRQALHVYLGAAERLREVPTQAMDDPHAGTQSPSRCAAAENREDAQGRSLPYRVTQPCRNERP